MSPAVSVGRGEAGSRESYHDTTARVSEDCGQASAASSSGAVGSFEVVNAPVSNSASMLAFRRVCMLVGMRILHDAVLM